MFAHLWAMVSTVLLAKRLQMVCWSSWSVFWSTLAVASSMHRIWNVWRGWAGGQRRRLVLAPAKAPASTFRRGPGQPTPACSSPPPALKEKLTWSSETSPYSLPHPSHTPAFFPALSNVSSSHLTLASVRRALARHSSCLCPSDKLRPPSPSSPSRPPTRHSIYTPGS